CTICSGDHHSSICRISSKEAVQKPKVSHSSNTSNNNANAAQPRRPPFVEPELPTDKRMLLRVESPIVHPQSTFVSLISARDDTKRRYNSTISVKAHSKSTTAMARAFVNSTTASNSFISPQLLARLNMQPIRLNP